jgi:hypothetical protein
VTCIAFVFHNDTTILNRGKMIFIFLTINRTEKKQILPKHKHQLSRKKMLVLQEFIQKIDSHVTFQHQSNSRRFNLR